MSARLSPTAVGQWLGQKRLVQTMANAATPGGLAPERLRTLFFTEATARQPKISDCIAEDPQSVNSVLMQAAAMGLDVSGPAKEIHLIPRNSKWPGTRDYRMTLTYIIGVRGWTKLLRRDPEVLEINAKPVYAAELETFKYSNDPPTLHHPWTQEPAEGWKDEDLVAAYARVTYRSGARVQVIVGPSRIAKAMSYCRTDRDGKRRFWDDHKPEMWVKTALLDLCRSPLVSTSGPSVLAMQAAIASADQHIDVIEAEDVPEPSPLQLPVDELRGVLDATEAREAVPVVVEPDIEALEAALSPEQLAEVCRGFQFGPDASLADMAPEVRAAYAAALQGAG